MSETIVPSDKSQEKRMHSAPQNMKFVGSRQGGSEDHSRTKQASIKHQNPEYFKRQTDKKNSDESKLARSPALLEHLRKNNPKLYSAHSKAIQAENKTIRESNKMANKAMSEDIRGKR